MDNITHSLIGVALGKSVFRREEPRIQRAAIWTAVIGSNLPDLDILISAMTGGTKISYLLHHRGWTHTILFAVPGAFFAAWLGAKLARQPKGKPPIWKRMLPLAFISVLLHLLADYANNYGIHPFAPFESRWYYGDTLFIVEPAVWLAMLPLLFMRLRSWTFRILSFLFYGAVLALIWNAPMVPQYLAYALSTWAAVFFLFQLFSKGPAPAWAGLFLTIAIFGSASHLAKARMRQEHKALAPFEVLKDVVLTPAPGNPLCWNALVVSQILDERYIVRNAGLSFWPEVASPDTCYFRMQNLRTAPWKPTSLVLGSSGPAIPAKNGVVWIGDYRGTISEALELKKRYCAFDQFLRFSRVPYWNVGERTGIAGDLRYDFEPELGFAEFELKENDPQCLTFPPHWTPPRAFLPPIQTIPQRGENSDVTR